MFNDFLKAYIVSQDTISSANKLEYYIYHYERCKKDCDKHKLLSLIVFHIENTINSVSAIQLIHNDIMNNKITKKRE